MKRLPNGYGNVSKLSGTRRRPFVVRTPQGDILDYAETRMKGIEMLTEYHDDPYDINVRKLTLKELYERYTKTKTYKELSKSARTGMRTAFNKLEKLYNVAYRRIKVPQMQKATEDAGGPSPQHQMRNFFYHMDSYARTLEIKDKDHYDLIKVKSVVSKSGKVVSEKEIEEMWQNVHDEYTKHFLILIYTGFRIAAYVNFTVDNVNLEEMYFKGGVKTEAGKDRIVPIHPRIQPFVLKMIAETDKFLLPELQEYKRPDEKFRNELKKTIVKNKYTPHDARHTFRTRLHKKGVDKLTLDLLFGHGETSLEKTYTHLDVEDLREAIDKLD